MSERKGMTGDYAEKGSYHEHIDPRWKYYPVYIEKKKFVYKILETQKGKKVLDMGCGEGVFVKELRSQGHMIEGLDFNFESDLVKKGNILGTPFPDASFDIILCLDVIEHLNLGDHPQAMKEIHRLLKPGGTMICSLPNLAHLASRFSFFFLGKLLRTATIDRHPGDRPYVEFKDLITETGFCINKVKGLFLTTPLLSLWTLLSPRSSLWGHIVYNSVFNFPSLSFLSIFIARKQS